MLQQHLLCESGSRRSSKLIITMLLSFQNGLFLIQEEQTQASESFMVLLQAEWEVYKWEERDLSLLEGPVQRKGKQLPLCTVFVKFRCR